MIPTLCFYRNRLTQTILGLLICGSCFSQTSTLRFRHLSVEDGLTSNYVTCITQDRKGFMWIGSWKGLDRYDGYEIKPFKHDPNDSLSLGEGAVYALLEDRKGVLWVGRGPGLDRYDPLSETFIHCSKSKGDTSGFEIGSVLCFLEDTNGRLWIGATNGLILMDRETGTFKRYSHDDADPYSLSANLILSMTEAGDGKLWVGTGYGLNEFDPSTGKCRVFQHARDTPWTPSTVTNNVIFDLLQGPDGLLYVCEKGGLDVYDPQNSQAPFRQFFNATHRILLDRNDGALWMGTFKGLFRLKGPDTLGREAFFAETGVPEGLSSSWINELFQDREGTLWIGTDNGISLLTPEALQFRHYKNHPEDPSSLSQNRLASVTVGHDGAVWIGTNGAGLNRLDIRTGKIDRYPYSTSGTAPRSSSSGTIFSVSEDRFGMIWVGFFNTGLDRLDPKTGLFTHFRWNDSRDLVSYFYEDTNGVMWLGHQGGVSRYDRAADKFEFMSCIAPGVIRGNVPVVTGILEDASGGYWVSSNGLYLNKFDPNSQAFQRYLPDPGNSGSVASSNVQSIYVDVNGQLWIGTDKGLDLFDREHDSFQHFGLADGLPDLMMGQMEEDGKGRLWIATGKGITRFDPLNRSFRNYDKTDGLSSNESWDFTKDPASGMMYIATADGLTVFHPDSLQDNPVAPSVVFTRFLHYDGRLHRQVEEKGISERSALTLSHQDDIITLEFAALSFRKSGKNQYAYKLEGFQNEWIPLGTKREVSFTNLNPGTYLLRVKASNGDGVWNEEGAALKITVLPPWWASWWAYSIYVLLAGGGIYTFYRFQLKRKLAAAENLRLKELDLVKTRLYTNITHEFRTPLTVIGGMVEQIRQNPEKWQEEGLEMIRRNNQGLLRLVSQMLNLSKLESGTLPVHLIRDDVLLHLKYWCESFHSFAESKNILLRLESDPETCEMDFDPEKMEQIVSNLLSNALRFTPEGGEVTLKARRMTTSQPGSELTVDHLEIRVLDSGPGISKEHLPFIFDRFYQAEQPGGQYRGGTGIGLALTQELVKLLGGYIEASSPSDGGAVFAVRLPLRQPGVEAVRVGRREPPGKGENDGLPSAAVIPPLATGELQGNGEHLLIVEDNVDVARYLTACLGERYRLSIAPDGPAGLQQALEQIPDLIISDVMMPGMDGFELCTAIKQDKRSSHIPVILLTARGDLDSKLEGLQHGADEYLVKPFNKQELLIRVQKLIDLRRSLQAHYLALAASAPTPSGPEAPAEENAFVLKVRTIIEAHLTDTGLDVERLCREIGMSNSNLHRKLTALTGYSTNRFIRFIRLSKACNMLLDPELTIVAVAYDCGFNDPVYFARAFRQEFGMSPSEWRQTKGS